MKSTLFPLWALLLVLAIAGCGKSANDEEETVPSEGSTSTQSTGSSTVTYHWLVTNIFEPKCGSCHDFGTYSNVLREIIKGNPAKSSLYKMVQSGKMPQQGTRLTSNQLKAIWTWIQAGGKNN